PTAQPVNKLAANVKMIHRLSMALPLELDIFQTPPLESRRRSGTVVAIAVILASVFLPVAFIGGIQGRLNIQFAVTIAISMLISDFNALTLSPALSALLVLRLLSSPVA